MTWMTERTRNAVMATEKMAAAEAEVVLIKN
jgi:hypothetical protein